MHKIGGGWKAPVGKQRKTGQNTVSADIRLLKVDPRGRPRRKKRRAIGRRNVNPATCGLPKEDVCNKSVSVTHMQDMYYISRHGSHTVHCSYSVSVIHIVEKIGVILTVTAKFA